MNDKSLFRLPFGLDRIFYGWWIVIASFLISLYTGGVIYYGFTAFFNPLVKEFGWNYTEISFALSLRGIEMSFLSPLVGFLIDRYGSKWLALWGVITVGLGLILLSFTQSLVIFYTSIVLIAFGGGGCAGIVFMQITINWFQRKIGLALGIVTSGFGASGLIIPLIVWLIDDFGWRLAVIILGAGMWVIGIPLVLILRNTPEAYGCLPDGRKTDESAQVKAGEINAANDDVPFGNALRHRAFLFLALSEAIRMMALMAVITHIMPYLNTLQIPRTTAGLIAGLVTVLSIAGRLGFGWISDFFDKRYVIATSLGLMSLGMFALCYVDILWVMILFLVLFPMGFGGAVSLRGAILREYFGREAFGRLIGIVMGFSSFGGIIGPTLAGYIFDTTGSYYTAWIGLAITTSVTVLLMLSVDRRVKPA